MLIPTCPVPRTMLDGGLGSAENWIFSDGFVERLRFEIDPAWQGEIPRTVLIARDGTATTIRGPPKYPTSKNGWFSKRWRETKMRKTIEPPRAVACA